MTRTYTDPVARLLDYGKLDIRRADEPWPDYLDLGLTTEHVGDLIRMTKDRALNGSDQDSLEVWAPLHAWRALGQLRAVEAVESLVRLYDKLPEDDWLRMELPTVFSLIGPTAIPVVAAFIGDQSVDELNRISAPDCLERIALDHPDSRTACVDALARQLTSYERNGPTLNAFLILGLTDLKAGEHIEVIRAAFAADRVDISVLGDVEDVEIELGLRRCRATPPPKYQWVRDTPAIDDDSRFRLDQPAGTFKTPHRKVGRNEPCPCGSGKKFKKCCLI